VRQIREIIIHCSATGPQMDIGRAEIRDWHINDRGFTDIGYHYVIRRNGSVEAGRPLDQVGAHTQGHNQHSIGICMVGGINRAGQPDCNFTAAQWAALHDLVSDLVEQYDGVTVTGHRAYTTAKQCPCFDAQAWWQGVTPQHA
jgi:N-acetylmuramoyl-L-alanine amidase